MVYHSWLRALGSDRRLMTAACLRKERLRICRTLRRERYARAECGFAHRNGGRL